MHGHDSDLVPPLLRQGCASGRCVMLVRGPGPFWALCPVAGAVTSPGSTTCSNACPAGTGLPFYGAVECVTCPAGTFNDGSSLSCAPCALGQTSGAGAPFCCPVVFWSGWTTGFYVDKYGVEGAHSCLAYYPNHASTFDLNNALCRSNVGYDDPNAHLLTSKQSRNIAPWDSGLLSTAVALYAQGYPGCGPTPEFAIGANTTIAPFGPVVAANWTWMDGTDASVLNCWITGCNLWKPTDPKYAATVIRDCCTCLFESCWHFGALHVRFTGNRCRVSLLGGHFFFVVWHRT